MNHSKISDVPAIQKMKLDEAVKGIMAMLTDLPYEAYRGFEFSCDGDEWKLVIQRAGPEAKPEGVT